MILIKPSIEFMDMTQNPLQIIERAGRTCYKSEDKITKGSAEKFVRMLLKRGHEAMEAEEMDDLLFGYFAIEGERIDAWNAVIEYGYWYG